MDWSGESVQMKVRRWLENAIMRLVFANTISYKRVALLSFELEFTESLLDILSYSKSSTEPTMVGLEEKFS